MDKSSYILVEIIDGQVIDFNQKCKYIEVKENTVSFYHRLNDNEKIMLALIPLNSIKVIEHANLDWSKA